MWEFLNGYIGGLITILFGVFYVKLILRTPIVIKKYRLIICILIVTCLFQVLYLLDVTLLRSFCFFLMMAVLFKYSYNIETSKALLLGLFYSIILTLSDVITIIVSVLLLGKEVFYEVIAGSIISNVCVLIPTFLLSCLFKNLIYKATLIQIKYKFLYYSSLVIICILAIFYSAFSYAQGTADSLLALFCILILAGTLVNSFLQAYKNSQLVIKYDKLLEFIKKYEIEIDNQRMLRHETKNQFLTIKSKIIDKENNKYIINYIDEIINDNNAIINHTEYAKLKSLPSNGIKGLLYFKVSEARDRRIDVSISVANGVDNCFFKDLDSNSFNQVGKILGVFLDNAIEASELSDKKEMGIEIFFRGDDIEFVISNSYKASKPFPFFGRTTKGPGRGYGLLLVEKIISINKRYEHSTEITDKLYIQKVIIKKII